MDNDIIDILLAVHALTGILFLQNFKFWCYLQLKLDYNNKFFPLTMVDCIICFIIEQLKNVEEGDFQPS